MTHPAHPLPDVRILVAHRDAGLTQQAIAILYGCTASAVGKKLRAAGLTDKQQRRDRVKSAQFRQHVLDFGKAFAALKGRHPTVAEIAREFGRLPSMVGYHVQALRDAGQWPPMPPVQRKPKQSRLEKRLREVRGLVRAAKARTGRS